MSLQVRKILFKLSFITRGSLSKVFFRIAELAEVSTNIQVAPNQLGIGIQTHAKIRHIYLVQRSLGTQTLLKSADMNQVYNQLLQIILYEQRDFFSIYQKYNFLFPEKKNTLIDSFSKNYFEWLKRHIPDVTVLELGTDEASFHQQFLSKKL